MNRLRLLIFSYFPFVTFFLNAQAPQLYTPAESFAADDKFVSTTWFHWYAPNGGQLSGPWMPLEGRENWTGLTPWWKTQIKQAMMANLDVLLVHLIPSAEERREPFFKALGELRAEGYDVPKVAPFLDPLITWFEQPKVDLSTLAGKNEFADQYIRWYTQYYNNNPDGFAGNYLAKVDDRLVLSTWHLFLNFDNPTALTQTDLDSRLRAAFPGRPEFDNPTYVITPALNNPTFNFTAERWPLFEINEYNRTVSFNGIDAAQLKAGYWDQNVRNPGSFLPRDGGVNYRNAWDMVDASVERVYIESWNEYDEGTGVYAGDTGVPVTTNGNTNDDVWSATNDPYEYIRTTATSAANWNSHPELDALFLANDFPAAVTANTTESVTVTVRNTGDFSWTNAAGISLRQVTTDEAQFAGVGTIDDATNEIPIYGGVFRGRPLVFSIDLNVPNIRGEVETHWTMVRGGQPFGEQLTVSFNVLPPTGVGNPGAEIGLSVSPNPASEGIRVSWETPLGDAEISLHDLTGRKLQVFRGVASGQLLPFKVVPGLYQLVFSAEGEYYSQRIVFR